MPAVTAAPPGLDVYEERPPVVYQERQLYGREGYDEGYGGPALDW